MATLVEKPIMKIKIDSLKNHREAIPDVSKIWHEVLGKIWMPEIGIEEIEFLYHEEVKDDTAFTFIALYDEIPVGCCTMKLQDDFRPDLGPWISDLVVAPKFQKQGIGKKLLGVAVDKARDLGFKKLYLITFDPAIPPYYQNLGWNTIGIDAYKSHPITLMETDL